MSEAVILGDATGEHVRLAVTSYAHPGGLHVFDHNWLFAEVVARTSARAMRCHAFLRAEDFVAFDGELQALLAGSVERAVFEPVDPWVAIELERDGPGRFRLAVAARDGGSEKAIQLDQSFDRAAAERLQEQIGAVTQRFPVMT